MNLPEEVYMIRKHSANKMFNELFTIENLNKSISQTVFTMQPLQQPMDYKRVIFQKFIDKHYTEYENMSFKEILKRPYTRMLYPHANSSYPIVPDHILHHHSCDHVKQFGVKRNWDFFISAKGQSANFHAHDEIFTQVASGKKLWMIANNYKDLHALGIGPRDTPAKNIYGLIRDKRIRKCVAGPGDIIHIPKNAIHGMFNLKNTMASGCIILNHYRTFKRKIDML